MTLRRQWWPATLLNFSSSAWTKQRFLQPLPDASLVAFRAALLQASAASSDDSDRYAVIPSALEVQLMPFQREGVKFALRHSGRALIGDEMGLVRLQGVDGCAL